MEVPFGSFVYASARHRLTAEPLCLHAAWGAVTLPGLHGPSSSALTPSHFPVFPLPDPKIGPHRATVYLAVPRVFVFRCSSPWGLPSPTPGPSEPSSPPPPAPRWPRVLGPGASALGICLVPVHSFYFHNLHLQSFCSPFTFAGC